MLLSTHGCVCGSSRFGCSGRSARGGGQAVRPPPRGGVMSSLIRLRRRVALVSGGVALAGGLLAAATSPTAPAVVSGASNLCASVQTAPDDARVRPGRVKADPNSLTAEQIGKLGNPAHRNALAAGSVTIPTIYHVISDH